MNRSCRWNVGPDSDNWKNCGAPVAVTRKGEGYCHDHDPVPTPAGHRHPVTRRHYLQTIGRLREVKHADSALKEQITPYFFGIARSILIEMADCTYLFVPPGEETSAVTLTAARLMIAAKELENHSDAVESSGGE